MADSSKPPETPKTDQHPKPLRNDWEKVRQQQETIKEQIERNKQLRERVEETRKFRDSINSTFPRSSKNSAVRPPDKAEQESKSLEWPAPGSLYNALRTIGELGRRMSLALSPPPEKHKAEQSRSAGNFFPVAAWAKTSWQWSMRL
jgi:hypothetical protein